MRRIRQSQAAWYEPQAGQAQRVPSHSAPPGPGQDELGSLFRPRRPRDQP